MHYVFVILISFFFLVNSYYTSDYDENTPRHFIEKLTESDSSEDEPEPINTIINTNDKPKPLDAKNMLCEDFEEYAANCTDQAKRHYNSTMAPPFPNEFKNWCTAVQSLVTCEYDWNMDCKDVTEKIFNELTIKGQLHILDKVCTDDDFSIQYDATLNNCITAISKGWKACYTGLKHYTDQQKNATNNWVHYETHFFLCCARTRFRRCTLELLLNSSQHCSHQQSILLQKLSAIVSEGEIFQNCNFNMVYPSCPGGDPRPPTKMISKLMGEQHERVQSFVGRNGAFQALPDLKSYLDSSGGVIYVSFGSNFNPSTLSQDRVRLLLTVFSRLPYDVLCKWDAEDLPGKPSNVKIQKWLPQNDLLRHPKIKLFVTQAGMQSTDEAIVAGVPVLGIPLRADQFFNTEKYIQHKIGEKLNWDTLTEEEFYDTILKIAKDDSYRQNVVKLRKLIQDQPMSPLQRAVWWTEHVLRHGGARHLRAPAAGMGWAEYFELELVTALLGILGITLTIFVGILYLLGKLLRKLFVRKPKKD